MYELYKPLRNHLRRTSLIQSLGVIRAYLQYLQFGQPFPRDIQVHPEFFRGPQRANGVHEWELEVLAKELILNAPDVGEYDFRSWDILANSLNKLKDLENGIGERYDELLEKNILLEMYRIAHRQFPWQHRHPGALLTRYFKIFGRPDLSAMLEERIGLNAKTLYLIGLALMGVFLERFGLTLPPRVEITGITKPHVDRFIDHFSSDLATIRKEIANAQSYDQDYAYAFNPLKVRPLIRTDVNGTPMLIAPIPAYLLQRFTEGVYYEILNAPGFAAAFGTAFQDYVGEALVAANMRKTFTMLPEATYQVGKYQKHTVDWIVSDASADLFVECKTKRIRYAAKIALASTDVLDEDLDKMAGFVVQIYKTLADARNGLYTHWTPSDRPVYPIVLTLEEWYVFGHWIIPAIDKRIRTKLAEAGLDTAMLETHPYTICNIASFERAMQVMSQTGIRAVMEAKTTGERRLWELHSLLVGSFGEALKNTQRNLFPEDLQKIGPDS